MKLPKLPKPKSLWRHKNGNYYEVLLIANLYSERLEEYPITVVYIGVINGKIWSRPLDRWHGSMTEVEETSTTRHTDLGLPMRKSLIL